MKILVLSDTHIPVTTRSLPAVILETARKCDLCLHAGDFIGYEVYQTLNRVVKTHGVCGNMDEQDIIDKLPEKEVIQLDGVTIGLAHGRGAPDNVIASLDKIFHGNNNIDIFVFGHSHIATDKEINNKIYFNPGSPTDTMFAPRRSYGIIEINNKKISRKVVYLD
jgi:putative phosphoesterase